MLVVIHYYKVHSARVSEGKEIPVAFQYLSGDPVVTAYQDG